MIILDTKKDGIQQITDALASYNKLNSIEILSHGDAGAINLGSGSLDNDNITHYASKLSTWGSALTETGDILIYGCNVAEGESGSSFIQQLSTITGADIAASTDLTGAAALGGDWVLEKNTGNIEAKALASESYGELLAVPATIQNFGTGAPTANYLVNNSGANTLATTVDGFTVTSSDSLTSTTNSIYHATGSSATQWVKFTADNTDLATFNLDSFDWAMFVSGKDFVYTFSATGVVDKAFTVNVATNGIGGTFDLSTSGFTNISAFTLTISTPTTSNIPNADMQGMTLSNLQAPLSNAAPTATTVNFDTIPGADQAVLITGNNTAYTEPTNTIIVTTVGTANAALLKGATWGSGGTVSLGLCDVNCVLNDLTTVKIKKQDGSAFSFVSVWLFDSGFGAGTTGTIEGWKAGSKVYGPTAISFGVATTIAPTGWNDLDEVRLIAATDFAANMDDFKFDVPVVANNAPTISGATGGQTVNDNATATPFSTVTVGDSNGDNVSVAITFNGANGTFSSAGGGLTTNGVGSYTVNSGTIAAVNTILQALTFIPSTNQAAVSTSTTFTLTPNDGTVNGTPNSATVIAVNAVKPSVTITTNDSALKAGDVAALTFTLGESSVDFASGDVSVIGGLLSAFAGSSVNYTANFTPTTSSTTGATIDVAAGVFVDSGGAGNTAASQLAMSVDTLLPTVGFGSAIDNVGTVTGAVSSGSRTDDTSIALSGTNESGATVGVYNGVGFLAAATVAGTNWNYLATVANGITYQFNAKATDAAGNVSAATANHTIIGDTAAPTASLTSVVDNTGSITGALVSGDATDETTPALSGGNELGSTVNVYNNTSLLGAASVSGTGWTFTDGPLLDTSVRNYNIKETDTAGNTSAATVAFVLTVDTTAPTANFTAATDNVGTVTGTLTTADTTDDTLLVLSGSNAPGSTVNVYNGTTLLAAATVSGTGWSYSATVANATTYQFNVKETDAAGNTSTATTNFTVTGDTAAPTANFTAATDDVGTITGALASGDLTDDTALLLSGSNEAGSTVDIYNGIVQIATATVGGTSWSYTATIANGVTYQFNVKETDAAGNTSVATANFTVTGDTAAPTANLTAATDNVGTVTGNLTSGDTTDDTALILSGSNASASTVNVYNGTTLLGAATVSGIGWNYSATVANATTYQFNVKETDTAGNTSAATANFTVTGDTTAPTANLTAATDNVGTVTGTLVSGDTTDDTALVLSGSNATASTVNVYNGTTLLGVATVSGTGWSYNASVANATTYQFNVKEVDTAGNTSVATTSFTVIGDTVQPSVTISSNISVLKAGSVAKLTFTLSESSVDFAVADVVVSGGALSNFAGSGTTYTASFTPTTTTTSATVGIAGGVFTDAAGNSNTIATQLSMTIDTIQPTVSIASNFTALKVGDVATLTITLSESSTTFAVGDITVAGGSLSIFAGSGTAYTVSFTPTTNSTTGATVDIAAGVFTDAATNNNTAATQVVISVDTVVPTISTLLVSTDGVVSGADTLTSVAFSGTTTGVENAQNITVVIGGVNTIVAVTGNIFSGTANLSAVPDAAAINMTADVSDKAGNAATQFVGTVKKDTASPVITRSGAATVNHEAGTELH
ncbi:MAG: Ig-like domain-containing protein [Ghiorsea sp.]|nr:Ig-like domain-containing protein [Ghiorsea sp.]